MPGDAITMTTAARSQVESMIARVALGDRAAFDNLYVATSARLYAICLSVLKDRTEAEEALQDVYVSVWQAAGRYAVNGLSPMTWLITIARNRSIDRLRARKGGATVAVTDDDALDLPAPIPDGETAAIRAQEQQLLLACLDQMEGDRARAVRGVYLEGMSYADMAAAQGIPLNTVRTWLRRGLIWLKDCVGA